MSFPQPGPSKTFIPTERVRLHTFSAQAQTLLDNDMRHVRTEGDYCDDPEEMSVVAADTTYAEPPKSSPLETCVQDAFPEAPRYLQQDGVKVLRYQVEGVELVYKGEFVENKKHGQGVLTWPDGRQYEGQFVNDEFHGQGTMSWPDGCKYVGQYANGQKEGKGTLLFPNDSKYVGQFSKGKKHGPGMFFRADGTKKWSLWNMDQECKDEIGSEYSTDVASSYARSSTSGSSSSLSDGSSWQQEAQSRVSLASSTAENQKQWQRWRVIDTGGAKVRTGESTYSNKIGVLRQNEEVDVVKIKGNRLCVKNPVDGHRIGWVSSRTEGGLVIMKRIDQLESASTMVFDLQSVPSTESLSFAKKLSTRLSATFGRATSGKPSER